MEVFKLEDMKRGWFVGNFDPSIFKTEDTEVAVKEYREGDYEPEHFHKIATEITVIIDGMVRMKGNTYRKGDIIVVKPNESTDFLALVHTTTVCVKLPGATEDKYAVHSA